jgi:hypothetical protein
MWPRYFGLGLRLVLHEPKASVERGRGRGRQQCAGSCCAVASNLKPMQALDWLALVSPAMYRTVWVTISQTR